MGHMTLKKGIIAMRKLVSAATSLVMAATMVSAVAPVVAGAADAKKSLSLFAYKEATLQDGVKADGATITVSADAIAAGDVTIPVGVYIGEETADLQAAAAQYTVNSKDGDAASVRFEALNMADDYFTEEKEFTLNDGTSFTSSMIVTFAGEYSKRTGFESSGALQVGATQGQQSANTKNAYFAWSWTPTAGSKYAWTGDKSDVYPMSVFNVNLPKGLKEGTYTIDYCNYINEYGNPSCLLETVSKYDAINNSNLDLNTLTIKVGDASDAGTTTTTTSTTVTSGSGSTTTTTTKKPDGGDDVTGDFIVHFDNPEDENGYWHGKAGEEVFVDMYVESPEDKIAVGFDYTLKTEGNITLSDMGKKSPAFNNANWTINLAEMKFNGGAPGSDGHGLPIKEGKAAALLTFAIPEGTPDGLYAIEVVKAVMTDDTKPVANKFKVGTKKGYIQVGDAISTGTTTTASTAGSTTTTTTSTTKKTDGSTTTTTTSTTKKTDGSTTTTTSTTVKPGTKLYGDTNCDGFVRINDVVLLNKYLNDEKSYAIAEQGKINADCYKPKDGKELTPEDSDAIIKSIVHLVTLPVEK